MQRPIVVTEVFVVTFHDEPADEPGPAGGAEARGIAARAGGADLDVSALERDHRAAMAEARSGGLGSAVAGPAWGWAEAGRGAPTPLWPMPGAALNVVPNGAPTAPRVAPPAHVMPAERAMAAVPAPPVPIRSLHSMRESEFPPSVLPFPSERRMGNGAPVESGWPGAGPSVVATPPTALPARTEVRIAPSILRAMAAAADACGLSESEVWAEAARAWLARRGEDGAPWPPTPIAPTPVASTLIAGAAVPDGSAARERLIAARRRCWSAIDILLTDLRAPLYTRAAGEDGGAACAGVGPARGVRLVVPGGDEPPPAA